jgi:hypothetical protein
VPLKAEGEDGKFKGAFCNDVAPKGDLNQYFEVNDQQRARYLIYNADSNFDEQKVWNSTFLKYTKDIVLTPKEYDLDSVEMMLRNDTAKLFSDEEITWGEVTATRLTGEKDNYMFIVTDLVIKFPDLDK